MDDAINRLRLPEDQDRTFRQVRDCGCIRIRDHHPRIWDAANAMRNRGWISIRISPNRLYADISLTEAGRAIAG